MDLLVLLGPPAPSPPEQYILSSQALVSLLYVPSPPHAPDPGVGGLTGLLPLLCDWSSKEQATHRRRLPALGSGKKRF